MCLFCGCPLKTKEEIKNKLFNKISLKILIPIAIILTIAFTGFGMYYVKVEKPKKIYNKAIALSEEGKYNEANDLFNTIPDYEDVEVTQNQLKYELHAYAAINCVKECLKNPDSFQLYKIYFFSSNKKDFSTEINNDKRLNATNMQ